MQKQRNRTLDLLAEKERELEATKLVIQQSFRGNLYWREYVYGHYCTLFSSFVL